MTPVVLDASVLLAAVMQEPGHERVVGLKRPRYVSAVNMAEVRSRLSDYGMELATVEGLLSLVDKIVVDFTDSHAIASAELRPKTRNAGLSLGDRACLALAAALNGTAVTADRVWAKADLPISVEYIR